MNWQEHALNFRREGAQLVGVATLPERPRSTGVLIIVGGPQYRVGSHRQFVLLARRLAAEGYPALRFDYRGMGDSQGNLERFDRVHDDVAAAIEALRQESPGLERIVLWGLCDGASAALLYLHATSDPRVSGLVLLNPWISTATTQASTRVRHYYPQRLAQRAFWAKLVGGQLNAGALRGFFRSVGAAFKVRSVGEVGAPSYPQRMAQAWQAFGGVTMLMLSDQDYTAREFEAYCGSDPAWRRALRAHPPERVNLHQADHTCSRPEAERAMQDATLVLLSKVCAG